VISVVIPAHNEEAGVAPTVQRIASVLQNAGLKPFEIIVVDDASTDATRQVAEAAGARVVSHVKNFGYGKALKTGIEAAAYDIICITDADGTYEIEAIPRLAEQYNRGFDMVVGTRTGKHYRESSLKAPLRLILKGLVEFAAGQHIPDINSGLRLFSRTTIRDYFPHLCNTFSFTTSATLAYMLTQRSVGYQKIEYGARIGKTKVRLFRDALRTLHYIVQAILYYDPIKIFLIMAALALLLAVVTVVIGLIWQIRSAFLLSVGSILASMIIFCMGLLADLLVQIMRK